MAKIFSIVGLVLLSCGSLVANNNTEKDVSNKAKNTQVVIVGTIHKAHHKNPKYSPDVLKKIILSLKPDAILIELPLSLVEANGRPIKKIRDKYKSPECWAADTVARELGIEQIPYDRPDRQENFKKTNYFERQKRANKLANKWGEQVMKQDPNSIDLKIAKLMSYAGQAEGHLFMNSAPEIINSEAHDSIIRIKHSVWYDILPTILKKCPGYELLTEDYHFARDQWSERNRTMADNIIKATKKYPGKRIVVVTGATHRYILRDLLKDEPCIDLKEYWEVFDSAPAGVANAEQSTGSLTTLDRRKEGNIKEIATSVAGSEGSTGDRAKKLVKWMNENFEWTSTDYKQRTVEEIIQRRGGNCAEQARVLMALLKAAGIQTRWVAEINIHPKSKRRQTDAEKLIAKHGNKLSVFGYMHNDHRWLEVYDNVVDEWIPADPSLGVFGVKEWIRVRLGFGERPKAAKDMIVPFVVIIRRKGHLVEDRSEHYLVNEFNKYYDNKLGKLSTWPQWVSAVHKLSKLGSAAFAGKLNMHEHANLMIQLEQAYLSLKKEYSALTLQERISGLVKLWAAIKYKCAVLEYAEVDWDQVLPAYLGKVDEMESDEQYYLTLEKMVALLKDNHTYLTNIPGRKKLYKPNLHIEPIEDQYVVTDFYRKDDSRPNIKIGDIIITVDDKDIEQILEEVKPYISASETEAVHRSLDRMLWRTENKEVVFKVKRSQETFDVALPAVIPSRRSFSTIGYDFSYRLLENDYGYIRIPNFRKSQIVEEFTKAIEELKNCKGLILDLRDNTGGSDNIGSKIAGRILKQHIYFYRPVVESLPLNMVQKLIDAKIQDVNVLKLGMSAEPSGSWQYDGPVVILVNWRTGSAAEDFTMGLQDCGRAHIIGQRTAGGTGMPFHVELPGWAKGRICRNAIVRLDGSRFHGVGIRPNIPVKRTIEGIAEGRDEILEAAIDYLRSSKDSQKPEYK